MKGSMRWVALAVVLAVGLMASGAFAQTAVRSANFNVLYLTPLYVAKEQGLFAKEGLDVEMLSIKAGRLGATALLANEAEFSSSSDIREGVLLRQRGKNLIRVYSVANRMTMDFVVRNEVIKAKGLSRELPLMERFKALKGMKIGITVPGALTDVVTRYYMRKAGLDPDRDASIITLGGENLVPAFRSGQIDGFMLSPPMPLWLEKDGHGKIVINSSAGDVPEFSNYEYVGITVVKEWADRHEKEVRAFIRAMNGANRLWRQNLGLAIDSAQKYFLKVPREIVRLSIESLKDSLSQDGVVKASAVKQYMDVLHATEPKQFPREALDASEGVHWTNKYNPNAG